MIEELLKFAEWLAGEYYVAEMEDDGERRNLKDARKSPERLVIEYLMNKKVSE
jgi:hypothetical protein